MPEEHVEYPEKFPKHCIKELVKIVRDGQILERKEEFALHAWNVQGYAQSMIVGAPDDQTWGEMPELTDEEACKVLEDCCEDEEKKEADPEAKSALPIPWPMLAAWVIKLIMKWLSKRKEDDSK